ncbi:hypothetical protein [uncultured Sphingomonas sp.]|uniref:hypothetical protein n=1 Tax=uncultured Sphingomonas sp. TaxID=158754 RepID=UPI0035C9FD44
MSRSRKTSPFVGITTAESDKPWKQQSARQVRRAVHQTLDGDAAPSRRVLGDGWGMKDGKQRISDPTPADWRK